MLFCVPVYIDMPRKSITASHISIIAVSITRKGFALYGCVFKIHLLENEGGRQHLPRNEKSHLWGVVLLLLYWRIVKYRILGSVSLFVWVEALRPSQQFFSHVGTEPPLSG